MKTILLALFVCGGFAASVNAQNAIWQDTTSGGPTMTGRPFSFTGLSNPTSQFSYHIQPFFVTASGQYTAESSTVSPLADQDGYLLIYAGSFDPNSPLTNLIAGDDDYVGAFSVLSGSSPQSTRASRIILGDGSNFGGSGTGLNLSDTVQYFAVNTWFVPGDQGTFQSGIGNGPGSVELGFIPAPGTLALLSIGGLVAARRRRA